MAVQRSAEKSTPAGSPGALAIILTVLLPYGLGYYLSYLYRTVNVVLAPSLVADLGLGPADLGLLTSVYFVVFAAFQIPLGVLLDRYGPRRVQGVLLLIGAVGSALFAVGPNFAVVTLGRGLIGLGVSGCLMAALKANVVWWPRERLPLVNGCIVAFGSFGALSATVPVEWLLEAIGWRPIFAALAIATAAVAILTFVLVPEKAQDASGPAPGGGVRAQFADMKLIYGDAFFWRIAMVGCLHNAAFLGYQTLWMGAWLRDVAAMPPSDVAQSLLLFNVGMFAGVLGIGAIADRLQKFGVRTTAIVAIGFICSLIVQASLVLEATAFARLLCLGFGFFGSATLLNYAVLGQYFPARLIGRANTAQNMMVFVGAFVSQWGIGAIISRWPILADGRYDPAGHRTALLVLMALEIMSLVWYLWPRRSTRRFED